MPTVEILAERVSHARGQSRRGDTLTGNLADLVPLVECGAAKWCDPVEGDGLQVDRTTWPWKVPEARKRIAAEESAATLRRWHAGEQRNPDYPPEGRKGVKNAIEERLGELKVDRAAEGLARGPEA